MDYVRANLPGFENCYMLDVASQMGVRQTRLLEGEYVVTKDDVTTRRHFADSVARGRDYYTRTGPCCPRAWTSCWSPAGTTRPPRTRSGCPARSRRAWRRARPPASPPRWRSKRASLVRDVSALDIQRGMRGQGADPGDVPSSNATIDLDAEVGA